MEAIGHQTNILNFIYWLGLLLLMFLSGAEARQLFTREERREVSWLAIVGTGIPFVLGTGARSRLIGPRSPARTGTVISLIIILAVGGGGNVGAGGLEDFRRLEDSSYPFCAAGSRRGRVGRYRPVAGAGGGHGAGWEERARSPPSVVSPDRDHRVLRTGPDARSRAIKRINKSRFNVIAKHSPVAYALAVLLGYCVVAGVLDVSLVFAAFLAGFAVVHTKRRLFADALDAIGKVSFAFFVPLYFAIVGLKLDLVRGFSFGDGICLHRRKLRDQNPFGFAGGALSRDFAAWI